jgi:hypothetical protein
MMMRLMTIAINGPEIGKENEIVKTSVQKWRSNKNRQKYIKVYPFLQDLLQNFLGWTQFYWRFRIMFF